MSDVTEADVIEAARRHDQAFNAHDVEARMASETTDIEAVLPGGITLRGPEQVMGLLQTFWEALPDAEVKAETQIVSDDAVAVEGSSRAATTAPSEARKATSHRAATASMFATQP